MTAGADARRGQASLILMVASGFAGLTYQIVWTQQCALWLGHEAAAVLAVVAAFFGGLAAGALTLGGRIAASARPGRWYAACELLVALWSLILIAGLEAFGDWAGRAMGVQPTALCQWAIAFGGTFVLLLPATAAMGATLPAIERAAATSAGGRGGHRWLAALYAANTAGAVAGVLATAFWLIPTLGLGRTAGIAAALNVLCGLGALVVFRSTVAPSSTMATPPALASSPATRGLLMRLALTGFLGVGFEVLVVRVLSQVTEDTVYTFALLLAVYLAGSAAGAAAYHRWLAGRRDRDALEDRLLAALGGACLIGTLSLWMADSLKAGVSRALGGGFRAAIAAEATLAMAAFGPATIVMGALFSRLADRATAAGIGFGRALATNTLGAAVAPALFGVVAVPALGAKLSLLLIAGGYLALIAPRAWRRPFVFGPAIVTLALVVLAPPLAFIDVPPGGRVLSYREGALAAVSVVEDDRGVARLRINDRQQEGSSATFHVDARQAWLPLLLHPAPARALFLGLGTGVTARAAADDPALRVDAVELLPEVIEAASLFRDGAADPTGDARLRVMAGDARRFVRASVDRYDVIVSDNFHPARSGSGALYTVAHFAAVRRRLADGGLFCQWLPLHQMDLETLQSITRSFLDAFPDGWALLANNSLETPVVGLLGRADRQRFDAAAIGERLARRGLPSREASLGLDDALAVLGSFVAGPSALRRFAGDADANTDDRPVVAYRAPHLTYAADSSPRDRLLSLLGRLSLTPAELIAGAPDAGWPARLAAYWAARDRFLVSGRDVRPSADVQQMLAQVREPLLSVLRLSPEFRPAYDPLLAMAASLAKVDAAGARALLTEMARLQPLRDEAPRALASLVANGPSSPAP